MKLDIRHFKNELADYGYILSKISRLEDQRLELEAKRGAHAIRYDRVGTNPDPLSVNLNRLSDIDKAEYLSNQIKQFMDKLERINRFLDSCDIGEPIRRIHCLGTSTYEKEAKKLNLGVKTLKRKVNKRILDFLINEEYGSL